MKTIKGLSLLLALTCVLFACHKNKVNGRRNLKLVPTKDLMDLSYKMYDTFLKENTVVPDSDPRTQQVKKVGKKLQLSVEKYFAEKKISEELKDYKWEFNLIKNDTVANAWCMPGGKVVVYTGLLPVANSEEYLAVVLSHEIIHAVAGHGSERMSQEMLVAFGRKTLSVATIAHPKRVKEIMYMSYDVPTQLGLLQYSRRDEKEADKYGLALMALSGYDPVNSLHFWEKFAKAEEKKEKVPELLSTHPSDKNRIEYIKKNLPKAQKFYIK